MFDETLIGKYAGFKPIALPHQQAQYRLLQERFNYSRSGEILTLHGRLLDNRPFGPHLATEFENYQPVRLHFEDFDYRALIGKMVRIAGYRNAKTDYISRKHRTTNYRLFIVKDIYEEEFPWEEELHSNPPPIKNIDEYLSYLNFSEDGKPTQAFLLSLIGIQKPQGAAGIGMLVHIPSAQDSNVFEPVKKAYLMLDPFKIKEKTQFDRYSIADYATPAAKEIITRNTNYREVDYVFGTKPNRSDMVTSKILSNNAELFSTINEEGLNNLRFNKENTNDVKYSLWYASKVVHPTTTPEAHEEFSKMEIRITERILKETSIDYSPTAEIMGRRKLEDSAIALAKANGEKFVTDATVRKIEGIVANGLMGVFNDPEMEDILAKRSLEMRKEFTLEREGTYKPLQDLHERIMIELTLKPQTKEELWERICADFKRKLFDKTIEQLFLWGHIYERGGLLHKS